jgi:hypothetical protein
MVRVKLGWDEVDVEVSFVLSQTHVAWDPLTR